MLRQKGTALNTRDGTTSRVLFTPDGCSVLAVDDSGGGVLWPSNLADWQQHACAIAGRNLTRTEWSRLLPGRDYAKVC